MQMIIEVAAARAGGRIPLGIMTLRQALKMPHAEEFRYRHVTDDRHSDKSISRRELENLAKQ